MLYLNDEHCLIGRHIEKRISLIWRGSIKLLRFVVGVRAREATAGAKAACAGAASARQCRFRLPAAVSCWTAQQRRRLSRTLAEQLVDSRPWVAIVAGASSSCSRKRTIDLSCQYDEIVGVAQPPTINGEIDQRRWWRRSALSASQPHRCAAEAFIATRVILIEPCVMVTPASRCCAKTDADTIVGAARNRRYATPHAKRTTLLVTSRRAAAHRADPQHDG